MTRADRIIARLQFEAPGRPAISARTDIVTIGNIDWRATASGMGVEARVAGSEESLRECLRETAGHAGPVLVAARISARAYPHMMRALRGDP